jgi:glycogen(starch) synthase
MRILHLSWEYPPEVYGGLGRHVHALATEQARQGDEVVVLTQWVDGCAPDEVVDGVRVIRVPNAAPFAPDWRAEFIAWCFGFNTAVARAGMALARTWRPDAVHGHDWLVAQAAVLIRAATDIPFVATVHATEHGRTHGDLATEQSRAIDSTERWMVAEANAVIVCSSFMRDEVVRLFGRGADDVSVIPNGVDPSAWESTPSRRRAARVRYGSPLIAYCGRLEEEKGVQTLMDAMPAILRAVPAARAVVIGEGSARPALEALARRRRVGHAVTFAGYLPEERMRAAVAAADVDVVPSLYEPFGFVALEAMAAGTPLVASRTGGLAEIVEDGRTGWLVEPGDARELARAVAAVLERPSEGRRMAEAARTEIGKRYAWSAIADATDAVYRSVI